METLAGRYPNDDEAQIFYAITLNVAASPNDKTYANQLKGAARGGPGCLNRISASISGASAGVRLPSGGAAG